MSGMSLSRSRSRSAHSRCVTRMLADRPTPRPPRREHAAAGEHHRGRVNPPPENSGQTTPAQRRFCLTATRVTERDNGAEAALSLVVPRWQRGVAAEPVVGGAERPPRWRGRCSGCRPAQFRAGSRRRRPRIPRVTAVWARGRGPALLRTGSRSVTAFPPTTRARHATLFGSSMAFDKAHGGQLVGHCAAEQRFSGVAEYGVKCAEDFQRDQTVEAAVAA